MRCCLECFGKKKKKINVPENHKENNDNDNVDISPVSYAIRRNKMDKIQKKKCDSLNEKKSASPDIKPRRLYELKDKFRCMFCGGRNCKHENYLSHKNPAIHGLHSDQIDDHVFASQRPSNELIKKFSLIQTFKEKNIKLIVNLQRQGEHPYCGPNDLEEISGYSYTPSLFSSEGIRVRTSGWKDMDVPDSLQFMLEIVKDMYTTIFNEGANVLVHCHAGYGRTGIVIACYKIFKSNLTAEEAVREVRQRREKCIEKTCQMEYCKKFKEFIDRARTVFTTEKKDINYFLKNQIDIAFGTDVIKYAYVPKLMQLIFQAIVNLKTKNNLQYMDIYKSLNGTFEINDEVNVSISALIDAINQNHWESVETCGDVNIIAEVFYIWLDTSVKACVLPSQVKSIFDCEEVKHEYFNVIRNPEAATGDERKEVYAFIEKKLKKYEIEILKHVALFLVSISPETETWTDALKKEFQLMLEKLSIYILGYNIDLLYNEIDGNPITNRELNIEIVNQNILILQFLSASSKLDENFNFSLNINDFTSMTLNFNESVTVAKRTSYDKKLFPLPNCLTNISGSELENNPEKDNVLFGMFVALQKYFDKNNQEGKCQRSTDELLNEEVFPQKILSLSRGGHSFSGNYYVKSSSSQLIGRKDTGGARVCNCNTIIEERSSERDEKTAKQTRVNIQNITDDNNNNNIDKKNNNANSVEIIAKRESNKKQVEIEEIKTMKRTNCVRTKMRTVKDCKLRVEGILGEDMKINFGIFSSKLIACKDVLSDNM